MEDTNFKWLSSVTILVLTAVLILSNKSKFVEIKKFSFETSIPLVNVSNDGSIIIEPYRDTVTVYYDNVYTIYKKSYTKMDIDIWGKIVEDTTIYTDESDKGLYGTFQAVGSESRRSTRSSFFGYVKGEEVGMLYYPEGNRVSKHGVDTMKIQWGGEAYRDFLNLDNHRLTSRTVGMDNIIDKYVTIDRKDETYPDSVFVYYSGKTQKDSFSFNYKLEELNKMKISKVVMYFKKSYSEMYAATLPEREFSVRMLDSEIPDYNEISKIFEKFRKNDFH